MLVATFKRALRALVARVRIVGEALEERAWERPEPSAAADGLVSDEYKPESVG